MYISVLGEAYLVILVDPLHLLNDSNRCNNFHIIKAKVECSFGEYNEIIKC